MKDLFHLLYLSETEIPHLPQINKKKENIEITGIKEVFCEDFIEPFLNIKAFNPHVLHIIRDPRAVITSRNYGLYKKATGSKYPLLFMIRAWQKTFENHIKNKDNPKYYMITYEDLATNPEKTMEKICKFLNINYSKKLVDLRFYKDAAGNSWKSNSSFENPEIINTLNINRWKNVLSKKKIEVIEYYCFNQMKELGYEPSIKRQLKKPLFKENRDEIRDWIKKYKLQPEEPGE